jgi:hypothetical protein
MTTTIVRTETLARQLAAKQTLDASVDARDAAEAAAFLIGKAGAALSVLRTNGQTTLEALLALDNLTGQRTRAATLWLAVRALSLKGGDAVGLPGALASDPVVHALLAASGLVGTTDATDTVAGALASAWDRARLTAPARTLALDTSGVCALLEAGDAIAKLDLAGDPRGALARIDALTLRAAATTGGPAPVEAVVLETTKMETFNAEIFAPYTVRRLAFPKAAPHPTKLVESAALSSVVPPVPSYRPVLLPTVVASGALSDVQIEAITYAGEAHSQFLPGHPNDTNLPAPRQGFLIGHGTGVGKGRIVAGVFADNWAQGRHRHVWISESAHLIQQARADWVAVGGKASDIWDAREMSAQSPLPPVSGILFITYAGLRSVNGMGRVNQIVDWMGDEDGVVAFDESQNLRNSLDITKTSGFTQDASAQAVAAREVQDRLPRARVVYASATSASDVASLTYAHRLGLWGEWTAFTTVHTFVQAMEEGGTNALEMVARDMKSMGVYLAANMSFEGVTFERIEHRMTTAERTQHDAMSDIWLAVATRMRKAMITTGLTGHNAKILKREHTRPTTLFNMARARFFQATIAAMKTPVLIEAIKQDLKDGKSVLVQLTQTMEANANRAIAEAEEAGLGMDTVDVTPRDVLLAYLHKAFPVELWEKVKTASGGTALVKAVDAQGQPLLCPKAVAERDALIAQVMNTPIPEGPLEQIIDAFGTDVVAEATGRARRLVPGPNGRVLEDRTSDATPRDIASFMNDQKRVLVFSGAGATGQTYSASRTCANRRPRRHYVLQPGWRADQAIQGMGRSHRSNQEHAPEYVLLAIDLWADQRMVSRVAKGMRDLGAITRGQRQAASQDFFTQDDNLEDRFGQEAWGRFVEKLAKGEVHGLSLGQFAHEANLPLENVVQNGVFVKALMPPVHRFLNAMSAMSCDSQALFGHALREELVALRTEAVAKGSYDRGMETIRPDSLIKLDDVVIHRDARTGGETRLLKMLCIEKVEPMAFEEARARALTRGNTLVAKSLATGRVAIVCFPAGLNARFPSAKDIVHVFTPTGVRKRTRAEVVAEGWAPVDSAQGAALWVAEQTAHGLDDERTFWVVAGTLLPLWNKLPKEQTTVYRMETDEGEQIVGRLVPDTFVDKLLRRVDALHSGGIDAATVLTALEKGGIAHLANGWALQGRVYKTAGRVPGITVFLPEKEEAAVLKLRSKGLVKVRGGHDTEVAYKLPDDAHRATVLSLLLAIAPAVQACAL